MLWAIYGTDKPGSRALREQHLPAHAAYFTENRHVIFFAGPLQSDDASADVGVLYIVNVKDRAAAQAFLENDPFHRGGVFETTRVTRLRKGRFFDPALADAP
jgi:uncharacterized protein YciI